MMEWEPIETAPKDRAILLYIPPRHEKCDGGIVLSKWEEDEWYEGGGTFQTTIWYGYDENEVRGATHWAEKLSSPI